MAIPRLQIINLVITNNKHSNKSSLHLEENTVPSKLTSYDDANDFLT